jgi:hypothetical protein
VVQIDTIGGQLSGPNTNKPNDFPNPPNSIKARIISKDKNKSTDDLTVFWPMFSHDVMPLKEGEHAYVLFENPNEESRGLWLSRAAEPSTVVNSNLVLGTDKYKGVATSVGIDQAVADMEVPPDPITQSADFTVETGHPFVARVGDRVIEGSNNTIIIMGRDRPADPASGETANAGTIIIIAGRSKDKDLDMANDKSIIYVSENTDPDKNFGLGGSAVSQTPAIVVKSGEVRILGSGNVVVEGANIFIGDAGKAVEPAVLGKQLDTYLKSVVVNTPAGPGTLAPPPSSMYSQTVKVKP